MKHSIFGISFDHEVESVNNLFDEDYYEVDSAFYVSKKVYHHEEESFTFNYRYAILADWCDGQILYQLSLVPCADSLCPEKLREIAEFAGTDPEDVSIYEIEGYGCGITMDSVLVDGLEEVDDHLVDLIANVTEVIDSLRGFYLDKPVNRIGTTGWDLLDDSINGNDFMKKILG